MKKIWLEGGLSVKGNLLAVTNQSCFHWKLLVDVSIWICIRFESTRQWILNQVTPNPHSPFVGNSTQSELKSLFPVWFSSDIFILLSERIDFCSPHLIWSRAVQMINFPESQIKPRSISTFPIFHPILDQRYQRSTIKHAFGWFHLPKYCEFVLERNCCLSSIFKFPEKVSS